MVSAEVLRERKALAEEALRQRFEIARNGPSGSNKRRVSFDTTSPSDTEETVPTNDTTNNYSSGYDQGGIDTSRSTVKNVSIMESGYEENDDNHHEKKKLKKKSKKSKKSHKRNSKKSESKKKDYPEETKIRRRKKHSSSSTSKKSSKGNNDQNHHAISAHVKGFSGLGYAVLWLIWLSTGTFFFGYVRSDLGLFKGFFMAVNVGYSIGWGYPMEEHENLLYLSSLYVIIGSSFVAIALGFFAQKIVEDADNWFAKLSQRQEYERDIAPGQPIFTRLNAFRKYHKSAIRAIGLWIVWLSFMILYSMVTVEWSFAQAQYFAISSLSTGGLWGLPSDAPDFVFGLTGFFACFGVPIMGIAMTKVAKMFVTTGDVEDLKATLGQTVTEEEIMTLNALGLEDGDGIIEKSEFIILCMMRLGTDPGVIQFITDQFNKLDKDGDGTLTLQEITKRKSITLDRVLSKANIHKHLLDLDLDDDDSDNSDHDKDPGV